MGYLGAIHSGLTEHEIIQILSSNPEILHSTKNEFHKQENELIPTSYYTMLMENLSPFLHVIDTDGMTLYKIKDDIFKNKIFSLLNINKEIIYKDLSVFFQKKQNVRYLIEYIYALIHKDDVKEVFKQLNSDNIQKINLYLLIPILVFIYEKFSKSNNIAGFRQKYSNKLEEIQYFYKIELFDTLLNILLDSAITTDSINFFKDFSISFSSPFSKADWVMVAIEFEAMQILKHVGKDINKFNVTNIENVYPIARAVQLDKVDIVKFLVNHGANIHINTTTSWSPLLLAAENSSYEIIKFLIEQGINVNIENDGLTPLLLVTGSDTPSTLRCTNILLEHGAEINAMDTGSCKNRKIEYSAEGISIIKSILTGTTEESMLGKDIEAGHNTALSYAVSNGNVALTKLLLDSGSNITHINKNGENVLHFVSYSDNPLLLELLLNAGIRYVSTR